MIDWSHAIKVLENLRKRIGEAHNQRKIVEGVELSQDVVDFVISDTHHDSLGSNYANRIYGKPFVVSDKNRVRINGHWHLLDD